MRTDGPAPRGGSLSDHSRLTSVLTIAPEVILQGVGILWRPRAQLVEIDFFSTHRTGFRRTFGEIRGFHTRISDVCSMNE